MSLEAVHSFAGIRFPTDTEDDPNRRCEKVFQEKGGFHGEITEPAVAQVLYSLIIANQPGLVVETGASHGITSMWLDRAVAAYGGRYLGFEHKPQFANPANERIDGDIIVGKCPQIVVDTVEPGSVDFMFVDDDHKRPHVEAEVQSYMPLMAENSLMCFHDVLGRFGVWEVIEPLGAVRVVCRQPQTDRALFGGLAILPCNHVADREFV